MDILQAHTGTIGCIGLIVIHASATPTLLSEL